MHDFLTSCIGHWENTDSLRYADFPEVDISHYIIFFKSH